MMRIPTVGKSIAFVAALALAGMSVAPSTASAADLKQLAEQLVNKVKGNKGGCGGGKGADCKGSTQRAIRDAGRTVPAGQKAKSKKKKHIIVEEPEGPGDGPDGGSGGGAGKP